MTYKGHHCSQCDKLEKESFIKKETIIIKHDKENN